MMTFFSGPNFSLTVHKTSLPKQLDRIGSVVLWFIGQWTQTDKQANSEQKVFTLNPCAGSASLCPMNTWAVTTEFPWPSTSLNMWKIYYVNFIFVLVIKFPEYRIERTFSGYSSLCLGFLCLQGPYLRGVQISLWWQNKLYL